MERCRGIGTAGTKQKITVKGIQEEKSLGQRGGNIQMVQQEHQGENCNGGSPKKDVNTNI